METQVSMTVYPEHILIGDLIQVDGKVARVKMIYELWDDTFTFIVGCPKGRFAYVYKCQSNCPVTLLSI